LGRHSFCRLVLPNGYAYTGEIGLGELQDPHNRAKTPYFGPQGDKTIVATVFGMVIATGNAARIFCPSTTITT